MKLLVITQKVAQQDPILGFFHRWIEEFAKHFEKVTVICLEKGEYILPDNVKVLSLGKEEGASKFTYLVRFYSYIWRERKNYDAVFVHMNPEYCVLGGLFWRTWKKKILLWYVHRQSNFKLFLAEKLSNLIFTSSSESFRLQSGKVCYVGHGIDTKTFKFSPRPFSGQISVLHVGRISRIKNIDVIIQAARGTQLSLAGEPITADDEEYKKELMRLIGNSGANVHWLGAVPPIRMPEVYAQHTISINAAPDGGMDKSVLESWSAGCPAFACNKSFRIFFGEYAGMFSFKYRDPHDLAKKMENFLNSTDKEEIVSKLSKKVGAEYDVSRLIKRISDTLHA